MLDIRSLVIFSLILISGCATLFSGPDDKVSFTSDPPNVKVYMNTRYMGVTPLDITVKRVGFSVAKLPKFGFEKDGYRKQEFKLTTELNNTTFLNNITIVSYLTDAFSGSITQYSPTDYHIVLEKNDQGKYSKSFHRRSLVQNYILTNYYDLEGNIILGRGIHIDNLLALLEIRSEQSSQFLTLLKSEFGARKTPPDFLVSLDNSMKQSVHFKYNSFL